MKQQRLNGAQYTILFVNLLVVLFAAYVAYKGFSFFPHTAPRPVMTEADWRRFALQIFYRSFNPIFFVIAAQLIFNVVALGLATNDQSGESIKLVWLRAAIIGVLTLVLLTMVSALGAYQIYLTKPPYFG